MEVSRPGHGFLRHAAAPFSRTPLEKGVIAAMRSDATMIQPEGDRTAWIEFRPTTARAASTSRFPFARPSRFLERDRQLLERESAARHPECGSCARPDPVSRSADRTASSKVVDCRTLSPRTSWMFAWIDLRGARRLRFPRDLNARSREDPRRTYVRGRALLLTQRCASHPRARPHNRPILAKARRPGDCMTVET